MTTQVTTTVIEHSSDATFRTWVAEVIAMLIAAGITQTADTGQINTTTVTRPGTNTNAGYAIFRFNDTMQATAPIFFRIDFGTGGVATGPRMMLTVGTATNGSGTISGAGIASTNIGGGSTPASIVTNYVTRVCYVDGFLGMMWKLGGTAGTTAVLGYFSISRSVDSSETATAEGAAIYTGHSNPGVTMARYPTSASVAMTTGSYCLIAGGHATSLVSGAAQVFKHYLTLPKVVPNLFLLNVINTELGNNTTFTATPVSASHTYVSSGPQGVQQIGLPAAASTAIAMIWE